MAKDKKQCCNDCESFGLWIRGPTFSLYVNYILSAWGDWMWLFAAGLYLVFLANGSLRLAAIFGFSGGSLMFLLGGIIGDWVDRNGRMKVVSISLFIQNISVALCATSVCLALKFHEELYGSASGYLCPVIEGIIICLALVAFLASMAYKIAIEKDWIVVVAGGNTAKLTNLNAVTRAIDLSCKILAPTLAGLVMSYSHIAASIFIAIWNIVSVFCEFFLLRRVYKLVPELAVKGGNNAEAKSYELKDLSEADSQEKEPMKAAKDEATTPNKEQDSQIISSYNSLNGDLKQPLKCENDSLSTSTESVSVIQEAQSSKKKTCCQVIVEPFVTIVKGWKTYATQKVLFAGLSLAFLYMTVLGFDYVTTGYIYANGVKESYVGISMGLAGITGILGTFLFSKLNRRLGLERTGLIAFFSEIICLSLTIASIWVSGTVFDPTFSNPKPNCTAAVNMTNSSLVPNYVNVSSILDPGFGSRSKRDVSRLGLLDLGDDIYETSWKQDSYHQILKLGNEFPLPWSGLPSLKTDTYKTNERKRRDLFNEPIENAESSNVAEPPVSTVQNVHLTKHTNLPPGNPAQLTSVSSTPGMDDCEEEEEAATMSIILFLVGIITSRIGLWMADLVVTQLLQENVNELERGIVNGVQNSLNMLMDMVKNALVIAMPCVETFGILILLSFLFICIGAGFFVGHVARVDKNILICRGTTKNQDPFVVDDVDVKLPDQNAEVV